MNLALVFLVITSCLSAHAGQGGNGGDFIRQIFIERGKEIVSFLEKNETGQKFLKTNRISPRQLESVFSIDVVQVSETPLTDNGGSAVDAIGTPGKIILSQAAWRAYILKGISLDRMILHEALRAVGKNDDNYVISGMAPELPSFYEKHAVSAGYRLLREEFVDSRFPSAEELKSLAASRLSCERYSWDDSRPTRVEQEIAVWRDKVLKVFWVQDGVRYVKPETLYIDEELKTISAFVSEYVQVSMRTRTGKEFITEISDAKDDRSPTGVTNPSLRSKFFILCEQKQKETL